MSLSHASGNIFAGCRQVLARAFIHLMTGQAGQERSVIGNYLCSEWFSLCGILIRHKDVAGR